MKSGSIQILDMQNNPPSILKDFNNLNAEILDFIYDDVDKVVIFSDQERNLAAHKLSLELS